MLNSFLLQLEKGGFSIGAAKRRLTSSLIIGPGSGYNLVSINPNVMAVK